MNDFDIEKVRWWNIWKCNQACDMAKDAASTIISRTRTMTQWGYEPAVGTALADAEDKLTEALFAVKVAREEYERIAKPVLQAAE